MRQKLVTVYSEANPALPVRNSRRPWSRTQQGERVVIGDAKQRQVPLHRSSLASFHQQDAVSNSGYVWPLVLCAPWIFRRMTRKKCLRAQCRHAAQLMLKANLLDCVRLKTRFNSVSSLFSVSFTAADGEEPTSAGGSFFFIFLNAGDFPSRVRVCVCVCTRVSSAFIVRAAICISPHWSWSAAAVVV